MTLGNKLAKLRKENNYTQEQLAEILGVSRQAISKWESDTAYPETEKLIRLGRLYHCSMDYLLMDDVEEKPKEVVVHKLDLSAICYERVSKKKIGNLPLWHINIGYGRTAKGILAVGLVSKGVLSIGLFSLGLVSCGLFSIGLLALGSLAVGLIALGAISLGILAVGAISLGVFSLGALAMGDFSIGAAAIGKYAAMGDSAKAMVAIGGTEAMGTAFETMQPLAAYDRVTIRVVLDEIVPGYLALFKNMFLMFLK